MADSEDKDRLPETGDYPILQGMLGDLLLRPWFDWVTLRTIAHGYLPLSRAWAAAQLSGPSPEAFADAVPAEGLPRAVVARALRQVADRRALYDSAESLWLEAFFGGEAPRPDRLVEAELERQTAAHGLMSTRAAFLPFLRRLPPVRWEVGDPATVEARHAARLADPERAFPAPEPAEIELSRRVAGPGGPEHWLRFDAPVLGDTAWARVSEPAGVADPPSLIFLHGVAMETEMWRGMADSLTAKTIGPVRVIRPEGPWHNRRRPEGWYGGEPVIGRGPLGMIELFQAWIAEIAVLIRWARETSRGPVAVGGVSLGALTSQLLGSAANRWPAELRPDALFLVATSGTLLQVAEESGLTRAVKLQPRIAERGWTSETMARWLPLLEPRDPPAMGAERVVMVLGKSDDITHHEGGLDLAERWRVPDRNVFHRPQGHFSVSVGLLRDRAPLARLIEILGR